MDSDKENSLHSPEDQLNGITLREKNGPSTMIEQDLTPYAPKKLTSTELFDFDVDGEPKTRAEVHLIDTFPDLADLLDRVKVGASVARVGHDILDPVVTQLGKQSDAFHELRLQADAITEQIAPVAEYYGKVVRRLQQELTDILSPFGVGLPTEAWHVEAIKAVTMEKLKARSIAMQSNGKK